MSHNKNIKLIMVNERPTTTSRDIAKHFNKRHDNVLRDIENLACSPQFTQLNFEVGEYKDNSGKLCKEYIIYRDGFVFLTMGFTGKLAGEYKEAYINAFNQMEKQLHNGHQTPLEQGKPTINDILNAGVPLKKMVIKIGYTKQGEVISVDPLEPSSPPTINPQSSTIANKPLWMSIVENFFAEIENESIPERMRLNMLLANEIVTSPAGERARHRCLFFRASNLLSFFREVPRFFDLLNESSIHNSQDLIKQLQYGGILAFAGKTKEKGIPINSTIPSDTRRVPHLVAIDLVVLERDYGIVMSRNTRIAETLQ